MEDFRIDSVGKVAPEGYVWLEGVDIRTEELQAQRIATLEAALREIMGKEQLPYAERNSSPYTYDIAHKALSEEK